MAALAAIMKEARAQLAAYQGRATLSVADGHRTVHKTTTLISETLGLIVWLDRLHTGVDHGRD